MSVIDSYIDKMFTFSKQVSVKDGKNTNQSEDSVILSFDKNTYKFILATHNKIMNKRKVRNISKINENDSEVLLLKKKNPQKEIKDCVVEIKEKYQNLYTKTLYQIICLSLMRSSVFIVKDDTIENKFTNVTIKLNSEISTIEYMMSSIAYVINFSDEFANLIADLAGIIYQIIISGENDFSYEQIENSINALKTDTVRTIIMS